MKSFNLPYFELYIGYTIKVRKLLYLTKVLARKKGGRVCGTVASVLT